MIFNHKELSEDASKICSTPNKIVSITTYFTEKNDDELVMEMEVESLESGKVIASEIAMEFPVSDRVMACSPTIMPSRLHQRLSEAKSSAPSSVEEIEAKLRGANLRG